ncbi:MAG TPA: M20/M25/M40 family metallo-hydrolase, partial [Phycisphaerales bacterium]|nr:M20/M25/M40 family metallo-hydrolase [Phycisphaerales bacterium]
MNHALKSSPASLEKSFINWLLEVTSIPTAAGKEQYVIAWVRRWVAARKNIQIRADKAGNLFITQKPAASHADKAPLFITAHLDHPAFVVCSIDAKEREVEMEFRGGVNDPYFKNARLEFFGGPKGTLLATGKITELDSSAKPFKRVRVKVTGGASRIHVGDIARWALGPNLRKSVIRNGLLHAPACDDLAAVAAALSALEKIRNFKNMQHVGVLLTRAEEIGFIGTLAACTQRSVPRNARLICLENSRSFPESPIG